MRRVKYPRTPHLPWSLGRDRDDRFLEDTIHFQGHEVVVTVKYDGECTTIYPDGYTHARSVDGKFHDSQSWIKNYAATVCWNIPEHRRIVGEYLYAEHSIDYDSLKSYFYMFAMFGPHDMIPLVVDGEITNVIVPFNDCLWSWDETVQMAATIGCPTPEVLYRGVWDPNKIRALEKELDLEKVEGYVVRKTDWGYYSQFERQVAKFVRPNHVKTERHWSQSWRKNELPK